MERERSGKEGNAQQDQAVRTSEQALKDDVLVFAA